MHSFCQTEYGVGKIAIHYKDVPHLASVRVLKIQLMFYMYSLVLKDWNTLPWIGRVGQNKSVCNRFLYNAYGWKDVLKVEYNDPHKFASKSRGFPSTVRTNTVGHSWEFKF